MDSAEMDSASEGSQTWVAATANPHKLEEIQAAIAGVATIAARPKDLPDIDEDQPDLLGNARKKALTICQAVGKPSLADDTGLEVDALNGEPGVRSARFAGTDGDAEANMALLLERLGGVESHERTARFRTVLVLAFPNGSEVVAQGVVEGVIASERSGTDGFGYDPIFVPVEGDGRTFSEMNMDEKNAISHRGRAVRDLAAKVR